jgi:hypothetical protein
MHRRFLLFLLSVIPLGHAVAQQDSSTPCVGAPHIDATARPDNDLSFSTYAGPREPIPAPVRDKIYALAAEACFQLRAYSSDTLPLAHFYSGAFVIRRPEGSLVYVFARGSQFGWPTYFFIIYDSKTGRITPAPVAIFAKWASGDDAVCHRPFVSFEDLNGDGREELVVRERTHNGTSYNACVRHYYDIGSDFSLFPKLAVEERSLQDVRPDGTWLLRRVRPISPDSLVIATYLSVPGQKEREVGEVVLTKHPDATYRTTSYRIVNTQVLDPEYASALITDSPAHDEEFIRTGGTLWY